MEYCSRRFDDQLSKKTRCNRTEDRRVRKLEFEEASQASILNYINVMAIFIMFLVCWPSKGNMEEYTSCMFDRLLQILCY